MLCGQCELGHGWRQRGYATPKTKGYLCPTCRKTKWLNSFCLSPWLPLSSFYCARRNIDVIQGSHHDQSVDDLVVTQRIRADNICQSYSIIASNCSLTAFKSYPCPYFDPMVPIDDQPPIWSISSNGHPEALRRSLNVCLKLWAVSPKSLFNHLPSAFEACVARQVPSFRYRGYKQWSSACCNANFIASFAYPTSGKVLVLLEVFSLLIPLGHMCITSSVKPPLSVPILRS